MEKKLIPGTDGFLASTDGRIFDPFGNERPYYRNGDGYVIASVRGEGKWRTFGVHRLVALTFIGEQRTAERDHVNHIDGDIENNRLENLEFVSVLENNIHAALLAGNPEKPVIVAKSPEFQYSVMQTHEIACDIIGCTFGELWGAIKERRMINGWEVCYNSGALPKELRKTTDPSKYDRVGLKVMDVDTRKIERYPSMKALAEKLGTTPSLITQTLTTPEKLRLCMTKYIVVRDIHEIPDVTDEEIEAMRQRRNRPVLAANIHVGRIQIYGSGVEFYREHGLSKKTVTVSLKLDRLKPTEGWVYLYMSDRNMQRIKEFLNPSRETGI